MTKKQIVLSILDVLLYVVVFFLLQLVFTYLVALVAVVAQGGGLTAKAFLSAISGMDAKSLVAATVLSSVATLCLFAKTGWGPVSRSWLRTRPWGVLLWAALLALGTILPSEWIVEQMQFAMPESQAKLFEQLLGEPWGYLAIGVLAPLAEELVFRGAVLRRLLGMMPGRQWLAIVISALVFGAVHGNLPQFVHATVIGLILGWMYARTRSILPGVMFHWVNNTVAYLMFNLMPQMQDGQLIDLFHGDHKMMALGLIFSLFIIIPSLFQLHQRMRKAQ